MLSSSLKVELWYFFAGLCVCALLGFVFSYTAEFVALGLIAYVFRLFHLIYSLENWVNRTRRLNGPPKNELKGLWSELSYSIELIFLRHKKQKKRLKKVVKRVRKMGMALSDGVILLDDHENIEWWNKAAEELFGFKQQDLGYKLTNLIRNPDFVKYFDKALYEKPLQFALLNKDVRVEVKIHPFGKKEKLVFVRDVTRLYRLELMRKDFVANVSHELRTPLTVVRGYVETFAGCDIPQAWEKAFDQMQQQCLRMDGLISDLITLSNLETDDQAPEQERIKVATLLNVLVGDLKNLSGDKEIVIGCTNEELEIIGNERELRSALSNLVVNAINYSNAKAKIMVDCESLADEVVIHVTDTGIGIDPKHIPRLTERFYRVDDSRAVATGGTGLGLAIVKHALLKHNAKLTIVSKLGEGSTFSCHFPKINSQFNED